jgi:hypothetical protein
MAQAAMNWPEPDARAAKAPRTAQFDCSRGHPIRLRLIQGGARLSAASNLVKAVGVVLRTLERLIQHVLSGGKRVLQALVGSHLTGRRRLTFPNRVRQHGRCRE